MSAITKTIVVTGAGSGIGFAVAEAFVREGANVVLNGRKEDKLARAAVQIGHPERLACVAADVTRPDTADAIIAAAVQHFGRVDVLVNNAGIFHTKPFTDYTVAELDGFLGYLRGTFVLSQAAVRQMRRQGGGGAIVNIGTILAAELAERITVGKVNVDDYPSLSAQYGIRSIPTLLVFKQGEVVDRVIGVVPKQTLIDKLQSHLTT